MLLIALFFLITVTATFGSRKVLVEIARICLSMYVPTKSHIRASEIMDKNFFGVKEAIRHFGIKPTRKQIKALAEIPFTEAILEECKDTHILVAYFPISILDIHEKNAKLFFRNPSTQYYEWYNKQAFTKDRGKTMWQLVRKIPVDGSTSKAWMDQQALLGKNEETPMTTVLTYMIIGYYLATGVRLFEKIYVRCVDLDSEGYDSRIIVGYFGPDGISFDRSWDSDHFYSVGVAAGRRGNLEKLEY